MKNFYYSISCWGIFRCFYNFKNLLLLIVSIIVFISCQQDNVEEEKIDYNTDIYEVKTYKLERCVAVIRNGCGLDFYHQGDSGFDTLYFPSIGLPAWHPNNCADTGTTNYKEYEGEQYEFKYDLLFYNEYWYAPNANGDFYGSGNPVIFMYTDPYDDENSVQAAMVGQGVDCFDGFIFDSISKYEGALTSDPFMCLSDYRTEMHTSTVDGTIMIRDSISEVYASLTIGNKFRPNTGGVFELDDSADEAQRDLQPVFLVKTREGLFAKFMVTRFKGTGSDTKKLSIKWQAIAEK